MIYKSRNPNRLKTGALFVMQVIFGLLPAILFIMYVVFYTDWLDTATTSPTNMEPDYVMAYISAAAIVLCALADIILGRRYNILLSGLKGEKALVRIAKKYRKNYDIFLNCPIQYKRNRSEIDMIMLGKNGIIIVEAKNHSGTISGSESDEKWSQYKRYKDGKETEGEMKNPIKQITRQRDILKSIFRAEGIDVWIDGVVYFTNPIIRLKLSLKNPNSIVCASEKEMDDFINGYKCSKPIRKEDMEKIKAILKRISSQR